MLRRLSGLFPHVASLIVSDDCCKRLQLAWNCDTPPQTRPQSSGCRRCATRSYLHSSTVRRVNSNEQACLVPRLGQPRQRFFSEMDARRDGHAGKQHCSPASGLVCHQSYPAERGGIPRGGKPRGRLGGTVTLPALAMKLVMIITTANALGAKELARRLSLFRHAS